MKLKNTTPTIYVIFLLLSIAFASAQTVSIVTPAQDATISGTVEANVSVSEVVNMSQITVEAFSASTANSSYVRIGINSSPGNDSLWATVKLTTAAFEDASDYTLRANITNASYQATGQVGQDTNTGIDFDNTVPASATDITPSSYFGDASNVTIQSVVAGGRTTACTLLIGSKSFSMTHTGNSCSRSLNVFSDLPEGVTSFEIQATDGLNTTQVTDQIDVDTTGSNIVNLQIAQQAAAQAQGGGIQALTQWVQANRNIVLIGALILLIWLGM